MRKIDLPTHSSLQRPDFLFGVATASFQIEGGADSRLPCIWDTFCTEPGNIADNSNGLIACDHINRWREDLGLIAELGVDAYRFSVSWPRVVDANGKLNEQGIGFYLQLLDRLNELGIKPFVTLYHWDLPQYLEDTGGWLNRETAFAYQRYVDVVTRAFGERVHSYATFNEPFCSAQLGYETGVHAPGKTGRANGRRAAHHILLAHGLAMQVLAKNSPSSLNGIVLNFTPCYPVSDSCADIQATADADAYINQWYIQPLFEGRYPALLERLAAQDRPPIEDGDMKIIAQPLDFLGVNYYTRLTYSAPSQPDTFFTEHAHLSPKTDIGWEICPQALTTLLCDLHQRYPLPPVYITENGAAMADQLINGEVADDDRTAYYEQHMLAVHNAIENGVSIHGYFAWSLMDNFEWAEGYSKRFGLVYVDYATQQRIFKHSALAYRQLLQQRKEK